MIIHMSTAHRVAVESTGASAKRSRRMADILDAVAEREAISVADLACLLSISPATVRRDLAELSERGLVSRRHGGVSAASPTVERPVELRDIRFREAKRRIAAAVATLLPADRLTIALSGGTTTAEVARELSDRAGITIVTNSVTIAGLAGGPADRRVFMTGGLLRPRSFELVGSLAESAFTAITVGIAILGADGVNATAGFTTHDETEARTNHAMVCHAHRTIVVADGSKIGRSARARMATVDEVDLLVTDTSADPSELDALRAAGMDVVIADGEGASAH